MQIVIDELLEQQPCEDCISRKATIDAIYKKHVGGKDAVDNAPINDLYACGLEEAVDAIENMPPVTPSYNSVKPELDCISREAVEKITWEEPSYTDALNILTEVREKVRALPSVTPKAEWIPCSERLPASDEDVLVTNGRGMYIGWIDAIDKIWRVDSESEYFMYDIVAWMPLSEPYTGSEDKE